jgi:hypothetical protein
MARKGRNILEKIEKYLKKVISIETVTLGRNCSHRHYGARSELWCVSVIYRLSILISADVSQPIQKIIGIDYLMSADTIGIGCTMSVDTNNVSGIRGVTPPTRNSNHGEILVCAVRLSKFPPSAPSPPTTPHHRRRLPRCRAIPAFSLNTAGSDPIVVPNPHHRPQPPSPSLTPPLSMARHRHRLPRCLFRLPRRRRQCPHRRPRPRCTIPDFEG